MGWWEGRNRDCNLRPSRLHRICLRYTGGAASVAANAAHDPALTQVAQRLKCPLTPARRFIILIPGRSTWWGLPTGPNEFVTLSKSALLPFAAQRRGPSLLEGIQCIGRLCSP
jgi:hypothetical protein